ncbi:MAG: P22 phage major capsid protein family protein [Prochloraceae cyanobacterium]|nr:P22 phage major capsid protein family protein [Prochloraceae cyanobacterium]
MVANILNEIMPKILSKGMEVLKDKIFITRRINTDYSNDASKKGASIYIPLPPKIIVEDVIPSHIPPPNTPFEVEAAIITLERWRRSAFALTAEQIMQIRDDEPNDFLKTAATRLAEDINRYILGKMYRASFNYIGDPTQTAFSDGTSELAQKARRILDVEQAPSEDRSIVLNPYADEKAAGLQLFIRVDQSGSDTTLRTGEIGNRINFSWWSTQQMPDHITADGLDGAYQIDSTTHQPGDKQVTISLVTGSPNVDFVEGDLFHVAGDSQSYVVTRAAGINSTLLLEYSPKAKTAWADDAIISVVPSHSVNLAFQRTSTGFAARPRIEDMIQMQLGGKAVDTIVDLDTGLPLTYIIDPQYHETSHEYSILCGCGVIRPEHIVRIIGKANP